MSIYWNLLSKMDPPNWSKFVQNSYLERKKLKLLGVDQWIHLSERYRSSALRPQIRLEMSFSTPTLLAEEKSLHSFVAMAAKTDAEVSSILCVTPVETAADKLSALTWRVLTRDRKSNNDDPTMIRHLHDLTALEEVASASEDFRSLTTAFLDMDFTNRSAAACLPKFSGAERLKQALEMLKKDEQYAHEYEQFVRGMSYARQDDVPSFKEALAALKRLIGRILVDSSTPDQDA